MTPTDPSHPRAADYSGGRVVSVAKRTFKSFYDDQMTHHAGALTYYSLMSLLPALLLAVSLLGLLGQFPRTYNAILSYLDDIAPDAMLELIDASLRTALTSKGTALAALLLSLAVALYGTTGVLEAFRRALNVVYETDEGRGFVRRKAADVGSSLVLIALILVTLVLMIVGGGLADDLFDLIGLGSTAALIWSIARWPAAFAVAMLVFAWIYYLIPNVKQRHFTWVTPGAATGVLLWLLASGAFFFYVSNIGRVNATYGSFGAVIMLVGWLWLTHVAILFGAELNAEIEREKELSEGTPQAETLRMPEKEPEK